MIFPTKNREEMEAKYFSERLLGPRNEWGRFKQLYISNFFLSMSENTKKDF